MSASSASSFARCIPISRGSSHDPPTSSERPRRAKISERRTVGEAHDQVAAERQVQSRAHRDAADLRDRGLRELVERERDRAVEAHQVELVAVGRAARTEIGARAEVPARAREHEHAVGRAVGQLTEYFEQLLEHLVIDGVFLLGPVHA